jgi:hypothetical protein
MPDDVKLCACGCGQPRDRPGQRYRRACHTAYVRAWRERRAAADAALLLELAACAVRDGRPGLARRAAAAAERLITDMARRRVAGRPSVP